MADLGTAYINIVPKAPGISKKISDTVSGSGTQAGASLGKKLLKGIAAIGIGKAVKDTIVGAFKAGGALEQSFGGLDTIYGEASEQAKEFAKNAAQMGISANTYAEQAVGMGAALKAAFSGDTGKAALAANMAIQDMANNAAKLGTPIEQLQNAYAGFAKGNWTMLDNLKIGFGGTQAEAERLLKEAQKISGVEYKLSNLGDVYEAIHVIQGELGLTGVAAEEGSTTLTGSLAAVKASWENTMAALTTGEGLETAMSNLSTSVGNFADNIFRMLGELGPQLPGLVQNLAGIIIENAPELLPAGIELAVNAGLGLIEGIPKLIEKVPEIWERTKEAFGEVDWKQLGKDIMSGIVSGVVQGAVGLYNAIADIVKGARNKGQETAEVGSPSRLFARDIGRWIPAGIAMGAEQNVGVLNTAMRGLLDTSVSEMQRSVNYPTVTAAVERPVPQPVNVNVTLDANARKLLRVVRTENSTETRRTNYNGLVMA